MFSAFINIIDSLLGDQETVDDEPPVLPPNKAESISKDGIITGLYDGYGMIDDVVYFDMSVLHVDVEVSVFFFNFPNSYLAQTFNALH